MYGTVTVEHVRAAWGIADGAVEPAGSARLLLWPDGRVALHAFDYDPAGTPAGVYRLTVGGRGLLAAEAEAAQLNAYVADCEADAADEDLEAARQVLDQDRGRSAEEVLTAAGDGWADAAHTRGWQIISRHDELLRDQVSTGEATYYRAEVTGAWHPQGWSDASAARLTRDYPLSYLAQLGAQYLADHPAPTGTDDEPAPTHFLDEGA